MGSNLTSVIETGRGKVLVVTKTTFLFFFQRPHTSVMPYGAGDFVREPGVQLHYDTADPAVLRQLHEAVAELVAAVGLPEYVKAVHMGLFHPRPEKQHLAQHVVKVI